MPLEIIVCIKQVPHPEHFSRIVLDPKTRTLVREGIPAVINPLDLNALEEGLRIKERFSGRVIVLSMGPPQAKESLEEALAIGANEAILLCDRALGGADTLATSYALSSAIQKIGRFDLVLCGNETIDGGTAQVGPQLAEFLDIPHITSVEKIDFVTERSWVVQRALEQGYMKVRFEIPALLAVTKKINEPRLPTITGIMEAGTKPCKTWNLAHLGIEEGKIGIAGSPTKVVDIFEYKSQRKGEVWQGSAKEGVQKALKRLQELGVL